MGGQTILVTGANRGLGLETCRQLARQGHRVVLASRDADRGRAAAEALRQDGSSVMDWQLDVTDDGDIARTVAFVADELQGLDALVNNAGVALDGFNLDVARRTVGINTFAVMKLTDEASIRVNAVCPGWVRTDMGGSSAPVSVKRGAEGIVWAATLPEGGPTGGFFRHAQAISW